MGILSKMIKDGITAGKHSATRREAALAYGHHPSLAAHLPWAGIDDGCFYLADGSLASLLLLEDIACEGQTESFLIKIRDNLQRMLSPDTLSQDPNSPWIIQIYLQDELVLDGAVEQLKQYIDKRVKPNPCSEDYLSMMRAHYELVTQPQGLFFDAQVTKSTFRGKVRRIRMVVYRHLTSKTHLRKGRSALEAHKVAIGSLLKQLQSSGFSAKRGEGKDFYEWMLRWFNPNPQRANGSASELLKMHPYTEKDEQPYGYQFAEQLFCNTPVSDQEKGAWLFDGRPHKYLSIESLSEVPNVGHISAAREHEPSRHYALVDHLPQGSVFCLTIIIKSQVLVENAIKKIYKSAVGDGLDAQYARGDCDRAIREMHEGNALFPAVMGVYLQGKDYDELFDHEADVEKLLQNNGLKPVNPDYDFHPLQRYISALPMCFSYQFSEKYLGRARLVYARQLANLMPIYGRARGSNNPLMTLFNRAGELFTFDPYNRKDKTKNSHMLILGDTGSGKSVMGNMMAMSLMAVYRPRLVIIESGNSFRLYMQHCKTLGLKTHDIEINLNNPYPINVFANGNKALEQYERFKVNSAEFGLKYEALRQSQEKDYQSNDVSESRDYLTEMVFAAELMVTAGKKIEQENFRLSHASILQRAIILAATKRRDNNTPGEMIAQDVQAALNDIQQQAKEDKDDHIIAPAANMALCLERFCQSPLAASLFNRPGEALPDDVDVIRIDLDALKGESHASELSLAFIGIMNHVMDGAQRQQFDKRMTVVMIDEAHVITKNPMVSGHITQISKMARKLGLWLILLSQNLKDFPDDARKMLTMIEFWMLLDTSPDEIAQIERFKSLSDEDKSLIATVRKEPGLFTEGTILSPKNKAIFRSVPPRLAFALAMTEKDEKAARKTLMDQHNISEYAAAKMIAKQMIEQAGQS